MHVKQYIVFLQSCSRLFHILLLLLLPLQRTKGGKLQKKKKDEGRQCCGDHSKWHHVWVSWGTCDQFLTYFVFVFFLPACVSCHNFSGDQFLLSDLEMIPRFGVWKTCQTRFRNWTYSVDHLENSFIKRPGRPLNITIFYILILIKFYLILKEAVNTKSFPYKYTS